MSKPGRSASLWPLSARCSPSCTQRLCSRACSNRVRSVGTALCCDIVCGAMQCSVSYRRVEPCSVVSCVRCVMCGVVTHALILTSHVRARVCVALLASAEAKAPKPAAAPPAREGMCSCVCSCTRAHSCLFALVCGGLFTPQSHFPRHTTASKKPAPISLSADLGPEPCKASREPSIELYTCMAGPDPAPFRWRSLRKLVIWYAVPIALALRALGE